MISAPWGDSLVDIENGFQFIGEAGWVCQQENDNPFQKNRTCGQVVLGGCAVYRDLGVAKGESEGGGDGGIPVAKAGVGAIFSI